MAVGGGWAARSRGCGISLLVRLGKGRGTRPSRAVSLPRPAPRQVSPVRVCDFPSGRAGESCLLPRGLLGRVAARRGRPGCPQLTPETLAWAPLPQAGGTGKCWLGGALGPRPGLPLAGPATPGRGPDLSSVQWLLWGDGGPRLLPQFSETWRGWCSTLAVLVSLLASPPLLPDRYSVGRGSGCAQALEWVPWLLSDDVGCPSPGDGPCPEPPHGPAARLRLCARGGLSAWSDSDLWAPFLSPVPVG